MTAVVDTNVLVYRFDPREPRKQKQAADLLRRGLRDGNLVLPHQALVEFVAVVSRPLTGSEPLLSRSEACLEAEQMISTFPVLYPNDALLRTALRGAVAYQMSWFDAHLWAYAEANGIQTLLSEDFEHDRLYGSVRVENPFVSGERGGSRGHRVRKSR